MPRYLILLVIVAGVGGCFVPHTETNPPAAPAKASVAPPPAIQSPPQVESPQVEITPAAKKKIEEFMQIDPSQTVVFVSVEFADEVTRSGQNYHLRLGSNPDPAVNHLFESSGLQVALEKKHFSYLNGLKIHWLSISDDVGGFHFDNPNEKSGDSQPTPSDSSPPASPAP